MTQPKVQIASRISSAARDALRDRAAKAGVPQAQYLENAIMLHDDVDHVIHAVRVALGYVYGQEAKGPKTLRKAVLALLDHHAELSADLAKRGER